MFAPSLKFGRVLLESGGKRLEVNNPHISTYAWDEGIVAEGVYVTGDQLYYNCSVYFSLLDQYNDSGLGSWIENSDLRKYIKINISYFAQEPRTTPRIINKDINILDQNNLDLVTYLKADSNGNRYYEYPISFDLEPFDRNIQTQTITIVSYFDLKNFVLDQNLSTDGIENEFGQPLIIEIIRDFNVINSENIINNLILEDLIKTPINLQQLNSIQNDILTIVEKNQIKNNISTFCTDLFVSKDESNNIHLLFGIEKNKIIFSNSFMSNYENLIARSNTNTEFFNNILNSSIIKDIKLIKKQVKKKQSFNKLNNKIEDNTIIDDSKFTIFNVSDNIIDLYIEQNVANFGISTIRPFTFYSLVDNTNNFAENTSYEYSIEVTIQDNFKSLIYDEYINSLNSIKILEQYYSTISIPYVYNENTGTSYGHYDLSTDTFKNVGDLSSLISQVSDTINNFYNMYLYLYSINKDISFSSLDELALIFSSNVRRSLIIDETINSPNIYIISKTIDLMKNFISYFGKVFEFKTEIISQGFISELNFNNIITINYKFENTVTNNYYNNFLINKILLLKQSVLNNFPLIYSSELAKYLLDSGGNIQPIQNSNEHKIYNNNLSINNSISVDSKEFRLIVSLLNNYLIYLNDKDKNHTNFEASEQYNINLSPLESRKPYSSLVLNLLNAKGLDVKLFKINDVIATDTSTDNRGTQTQTDPLNYSIVTPRETVRNSSPIQDLILDETKKESIEKLLNYLLSSYNDNNANTTSYVEFAKKNSDLSGYVTDYIPKYTIKYLQGFGTSTKELIWNTLNENSFNSIIKEYNSNPTEPFSYRTKILCKLEPLINNISFELKNTINNLEVPYMYFILEKDTTEFTSTNSTINTLRETLSSGFSIEQRQNPFGQLRQDFNLAGNTSQNQMATPANTRNNIIQQESVTTNEIVNEQDVMQIPNSKLVEITQQKFVNQKVNEREPRISLPSNKIRITGR